VDWLHGMDEPVITPSKFLSNRLYGQLQGDFVDTELDRTSLTGCPRLLEFIAERTRSRR
jgi:hypothetical protein